MADKEKQTKKRWKGIKHWQLIALFLMGYDFMAIACSYFFALWMRFDFLYMDIPKQDLLTYAVSMPIYLAVSVAFFWMTQMYRGVWRFSGFRELLRYSASSLAASLVYGVVMLVLPHRMPISYSFVGAMLQLILIVCVRFSYRFYCELVKGAKSDAKEETDASRVMIIGAGEAGRSVIREMYQSDKLSSLPVCIIDDNPNKWNRYVEGVPVVGGRGSIPTAAQKYAVDQIYFCIPTASGENKKEILDICSTTGCTLQSLPGMYQLVKGEVLISTLKPVQLEDLLGRGVVHVQMEKAFAYLEGKVILVTGGGGSIGSELCRQIAKHHPKELIIFDIYENTTYGVELELREKYPELSLSVLIGSVRDSRRINQMFAQYHPDIVFHAAAHKHVPLMELSPNEAIKNNVIGTYKCAYAALMYGTERFVLISTDKAVNPTNVMGASKRLCEMVIQSMDAVSKSDRFDLLPFVHAHADKRIDGQVAADPVDHIAADRPLPEGGKEMPLIGSEEEEGRGRTQFVAVRFGNVLGSNGSVIPRFQAQIAAGGPVTVTHPDITRYFMTIPEAVSLVLQAGVYAWGGEIFVLDMGEPVKIDSLARKMIRLSGYKPDEDIKIVYTGLRPGEKLYEEKLMAEEGLKKTDNELIYIGKPVPFDVEHFFSQLEDLAYAAYANDENIVQKIREIVTTYHPSGEV